ncbi:MAG: SpoIVB peptidase [Oscillospiraceae bacterium]|jgi:stage IV sporulation protein B|nr:SpoIVB peptidase [Oscillospiraceae bacterium]
MEKFSILKTAPRKLLVSAFLSAALTFGGIYSIAAEAKSLVPMGNAVGIRLDAEGVLVISVPDTCADGATPSPARNAGVKAGDVILRVGKTRITSGDILKDVIKKLDGAPIALQVARGGDTVQLTVTPHKTGEGAYSFGLMVRDGVSGIGTMTFYDPETGAYGALGHSVSDGETGILLPLRGGVITRASVTDVAKGRSGTPGQLHGAFDFEEELGSITVNSDCGIFGVLVSRDASQRGALPVAEDSELHTGAATILSNVAGSEVREYQAEITRVYTGAEAVGRSMLVTVTDPALLERTGGIVQGMSGSPILQDGKLVGAVTHVLINDPTRGYGVSIGKMLEKIECNGAENKAA